jgi:hypothetical protein
MCKVYGCAIVLRFRIKVLGKSLISMFSSEARFTIIFTIFFQYKIYDMFQYKD